MPPRSYYVSPRLDDYIAILRALAPDAEDRPEEIRRAPGLPHIEDVDHVAAYVGVAPALLLQILHNPAFHYRLFDIEKNDGTKREICTPRTYLKAIQWWILDNILERFVCSDAVHGFRRGRSYISNATVHAGNAHILNVDIRKFFPSINKQMITGVFLKFGYSEGASDILSSLVTFRNEAPTGAPTSPMIGNIVLADFDEQMAAVAAENETRYTRYADDLTFSSPNRLSDNFCRLVEKSVRRFGFELNGRKTRFMGQGDRMEVTGIVVNNGINMPRAWRNNARGILHLAQQDPESFLEKFDLISGIYGTLVSVDREHNKPLTVNARRIVEELKRRRAATRTNAAAVSEQP